MRKESPSFMAGSSQETARHWEAYGIEQPGQQMEQKGYAITALKEQTGA